MRHARGARERRARMRSVRQPSHTDAAIQSINESEKDKRDCEKCEGELVCGGVFQGLYAVVDGDGDGTRSSGKIAADHEDDAEFAEGVCECEDNRGDYSRKGKGEDDAPKGAPIVCAENT